MFEGFSDRSVDFVWNLRFNNSKEWFLAHKTEYEQFLHTPIKALAFDLQAFFAEQYPRHSWNVHISRIYRDARRLHGRGPMNDHLWFALYADAEKDDAVPAFYFGFAPEGYDFGMGCWTQNGMLMQRLRDDVKRNPEPLDKLRRQLERQAVFALHGEQYKRPKVQVKPELMAWVNRKNLDLHCECPHGAEGFGKGLYDTVKNGYRLLMPLHDYLSRLAKAGFQETIKSSLRSLRR